MHHPSYFKINVDGGKKGGNYIITHTNTIIIQHVFISTAT